MSSVQLLDKTRKINRLLHNNSSQKVVFNDICKVMSEILSSDVLVVSRKGKLLGLRIVMTLKRLRNWYRIRLAVLWTGCSMRECLMYYPLRRMLILRHWVLQKDIQRNIMQ